MVGIWVTGGWGFVRLFFSIFLSVWNTDVETDFKTIPTEHLARRGGHVRLLTWSR